MDTAVIASLITGIVTLVGICVSYRMSNKNLKLEIESIKTQQSLLCMKDLPSRVASFLDDSRNDMDQADMAKLITDIYAYGSFDAIKILVAFQKTNYALSRSTPKQEDTYRQLCLMSLLITQLKFDFSNVLIPPENYIALKITDYHPDSYPIKETIESLVYELNLNEKYI